MPEISGFPFVELRFDKEGAPRSAPLALAPAGTTDLVVLAHGWKNTDDDAARLYAAILGNMRKAAGGALGRGGRRWAAAGVLWPAFLFRPDLTLLPSDGASPIAGAAAAVSGADLPKAELRAYAADVAADLGAPDPTVMAGAAVKAAGGGAPADDFVDALRALLSTADEGEARREHAALLTDRGRDLQATLRGGGVVDTAAPGEAMDPSAAGSASGLGTAVARRLASFRSGGSAAVGRLLNQATYFEMKARAGRVGGGLAEALAGQLEPGVRLHLVGHSFGGRLVTAAVANPRIPPVETLALLQAAFSHNGLGTGFGDAGRTVGAFRDVIERGRVAGAILATHTLNDRAVGLAYAIASAASGVIASGLGRGALIGGPHDLHGGMGANGAQSMRDGETLALVAGADATPDLRRGMVNNVLADAVVADHNDVENEAVGALVWAAVSAR